MDFAGAAEFIKALSAAIGGAVAWALARRETKAKKTESVAVDTVDTLESTIQRKNEQIEAWKETHATLKADYLRSREIIRDQDNRLARKDERIAHLERLIDQRGAAL